MLTRRARSIAARLVLGALLFTQAALAMAACDWARAAPAQALSAAGEPSCHEEPARNANLCLAHCLGGDQSTDKPQLQVAALAPAPVLTVVLPAVGVLPTAVLHHVLQSAAPPPPRILFQSFLL